jgi:hypothetical protein
VRGDHWSTAALLFVIGVAPAAGSGPPPSQHRADSRAAAYKSAPAGLPAEAARMYAAVKKPHPGELKWQTIPWLTDLAEGMRLAREEKRPLLLFVSGDDPLEKC